MSFEIRPLQEFLVRPALPRALERLPELGLNLMWSWNHSLRALFRRLDPGQWKASNHNPVLMLGRVSQETLERAAADPRYLALYRRSCEIHDAYLQAPGIQAPNSNKTSKPLLIAYFSMEYGLLDCMPIYSGGLGVLSGDHLKAASDAKVPLVGVGLLYQTGFLSQRLDPDGWQEERVIVNDFYSLPISPVTRADGTPMLVDVMLAGVQVYVKVWRIDIGRVKLYLLDTNIRENDDPIHRDITSRLYGGDLHKRIRQEIVLGIGGVRTLTALGLEPSVYHMNEGHSAFLALERIRVLMQGHSLSFPEALEASRSNNVFTTHTCVPAGIDLFDPGLMYQYFGDFCSEAEIPFEELLGLGRFHPTDPNEPFSMAVAALKMSSYRNAVSMLHRSVSQKMWEGLWPSMPVWEIPITSVTNGVHLASWINGDLASLYDQYLSPDWRDGLSDRKQWEQIREIPITELWEAHRRRKRQMVAFVQERAAASAIARKAPVAEVKRLEEVLNPEALTIGFARRFATYKRATLLFRDLDRLKKILSHPTRPVQIVIAGKAHPLDVPGKTLIREIVHHSRQGEFQGHIVFVEDYSIQVARELVGGVDVWLNTPRRGEEACGTSGMKAGINGVLNLSVLDGWFDEAETESEGWPIGDREPYSPERDDAHAAGLYSILENEIIPLYYERREQGVPVEWMERVVRSLEYLSSQFNSQRMVLEYLEQLYEPAHTGFAQTRQDSFALARNKVIWTANLGARWQDIRIVNYSSGAGTTVSTGSQIPLRALVDLAGLVPDDVRVEAVVGRVDGEGNLADVEVLTLRPLEQQDALFLFGTDFVPATTGRLGFSVRITANHFDDPLTRPCNTLFKWAGTS
jgi:starch phosphorylase